MEILIDDIPDEGLTLRADSKADSWLLLVFRGALGERFTNEDNVNLAVTLIKFEKNIDITGELELVSYPSCDRCLKKYREVDSIPLHIIMAPLYESKRQQEKEEQYEKELVQDDMGFSYYEGDRIDLSDIVREQILLSLPIKHICQEACKGICQRCGKDLNEGPCKCVEEHHDPRWDVLKTFKPAKAGKTGGSKLKAQSSKKKAQKR